MRELSIMLKLLKKNNQDINLGLFHPINNGVVLEEQKRNFIVYDVNEGIHSNRIICHNIKDACINILKRIDDSLIDNFLELCKVFKD